jgi:hypothetical protein
MGETNDARVIGERAGTADRDRFSALEASHRIDWRFLLPDLRLGHVAYIGDDDELVRALETGGASVEILQMPFREPAVARLFDGAVVAGNGITHLAAVRALLRPGGWLHVELPAESPVRRRFPPRRYRRALLQTGFERVETYWHFPSFRNRSAIVPLFDRTAMNSALARRENRLVDRMRAVVAKAVARAGLFERIAQHVSLLGVLPGASSNGGVLGFVQAQRVKLCLERYGFDSAQMSYFLITPPGIVSNCIVAALHPRGQPRPTLVAKVCRLTSGREQLEREAANLAVLHDVWDAARESAPEVVVSGDVAAHPVLIETAVPGEPLDPARVRAHPDRYIALVSEWLATMAKASGASLEAGWYRRLIERPLRELDSLLASDEMSAMIAGTLEHLAPLERRMKIGVFEHGDLAHPNLILTAKDGIGAVDWEKSNPRGLPLHDLVFFLTYVAFARRGALTTPARVAAFDEAFFGDGAWARPPVIRAAERIGVDRSLLSPLVLSCWSRYVAGIASTLADADMVAARATGRWHIPRSALPIGARGYVERGWYTALWNHTLEHLDNLTWPE